MAPPPQIRHDAYGRVIAYANQEGDRLEDEALDYLRTAEAQLEGVPVERPVRFGRVPERVRRKSDAPVLLLSLGRG